jgi:hypothetical protein
METGAGNVLVSHVHQHVITVKQQFRYGNIVGHNDECIAFVAANLGIRTLGCRMIDFLSVY